jgi:putative heme-binding domain-containing protein
LKTVLLLASLLLVSLSLRADDTARVSASVAQTLDEDLRRVPAAELAALAKSEGDAIRGAVLFFQQHMACSKCHAVGKASVNSLGPDLTTLGKEVSDESLVESVLSPSKVIRKGFESVTVITADGKSLAALLVERTKDKVVVRDISRGGEPTTIAAADIEEIKVNATSIMPAGQVNQLNSRQQFLDLIRYLIEIRDGGAAKALQLQPAASLLTFTVPEYEKHLDHAALIGDWNGDSLKRGEAIYQRVCANCHGTKDKPGSLPTSLRFAEGKFKNGSDPLSMYRTLTHGFGLMAPQTWMVPSQKYDVVHYVRETYLKPHNPTQFVAVDQALLSRLPKGDTRGPEPSKIVPWSAMDYGPSLAHTFEVPGLEHNLAYKGVAVRLDPGAGGVSRGRHWMIFDTDTLRAAAAWNGSGKADDNFIDWQGIQFNGAHGVHPRVVGQTAFANSTGPGWANPASGEFLDDLRVKGRDGNRYGPLPREWATYRGQYHHGQQVVFSYSIGTTEVLESPRLMTRESVIASPLVSERQDRSHARQSVGSSATSHALASVATASVATASVAKTGADQAPLFLRTFNIGPRDRDLLLQVAEHPAHDAQPTIISRADKSVVMFAPPSSEATAPREQRLTFDGNTYLEIPNGEAFDLTTKDFTIVARLKTKADGTIWSLSQSGPKWTPDGQTFFIRDGRLAFDIGWVGAVAAKSKINDDRWHHVVMTWQQSEHRVRLYVDGKLDGEGKLAAKATLPKSVVRIGFTTPDFPRPATFFQGDISQVRFYQRRLTEGLADFAKPIKNDKSLVAQWLLGEASGTKIADATTHRHDAEVRRGMAPVSSRSGPLVAGFAPRNIAAEWTAADGRLRLRIPAGQEPLRFTVWQPSNSVSGTALAAGLRQTPAASAVPLTKIDLADLPIPDADRDLTALTNGGPPRWPQKLETQTVLGADNGPFATDVLTAPESNPWLAQTRFTGLDFFPDGRIAVCSWDGDVWIVESQPGKADLRWQRIASGMFQPLGLKIVEGKIHVTCRDQLAVLHDLNGDGEIDFYQCLNNDHQVTEHFHEFAMGLQTDAAGNFYYAKSGCHGKAAVVPHHGTLLRVSKDGSRTDILANGFRAANGVCLNPDGSFVITDQEGFWNPKNRINWVTVDPSGTPKFYGNLLGYHDVTDSSDAAMVPPLCWITNAFDRSPAELLWVESDRWGPLKGSLLNLSYGYGKVFVVPHESVRGTMQGGLIELPIPLFPTGVMRGRFHPTDGQLYLCGMFAWAGNATYPGGLYRLRATGQPMHLPIGLYATKSGLKLTFTEPLDPASLDVKHLQIKTWSLKRTADYGSKHFDEKPLEVRSAKLSADSKTVTLDIAELRPTWCMEIRFSLRAATGTPVQGTIHNTIHELAD